MGKGKNKGANYKSQQRNALKEFTESTCRAVDSELKDIDVDTLIEGLFLKSNDKDIEFLIKEYEKQLILYKLDNEKFKKNLHNFFLEMDKYLKRNKLYKKFFKLVHMAYVALCTKDINNHILIGYQNLIIQQFAYFGNTTEKVCYGVTTDDKLLLTNEIGIGLTEINYYMAQMLKNPLTYRQNKMYDLFKKYGYNCNNLNDVQMVITHDQINTNMLYQMAYFIDETNMDLLPKKYKDPTELLDVHPIFMFKNEKIQEIREKLINRQVLLPSEGLYAKIKNCGEIVEVYFSEKIIEDNIVLLCKLFFDNGSSTLCFYDTQSQVFYNMWRDSTQEERTCIPLENIVLQIYMYLTCFLSKEELFNLFWFEEKKSIEELQKESIAPLIYFETREKIRHGKTFDTHTRHFDKRKYIAELTNISPFLRKLPFGHYASDDAKELAKKLGIDLPSGMTFVRGFTKKIYKEKDGK